MVEARRFRVREWIAQVEDMPCMTSSDKDTCKEFCTILDSIVQNHIQHLSDDGLLVTENITMVKENMEKIIQHLKYFPTSADRFVANFNTFKRIRNSSIEQLENIGKDLHKHRFNCNVSRVVGNSTSFCGGGHRFVCFGGVEIKSMGAMLLTGLALVPASAGVSTPLAVAGLCTSMAGSSTSLGASFTEKCLWRKKIKVVQRLINEDKEATKALGSWLSHAHELIEAIDFILNIEVMKGTKVILMRFIDQVAGVIRGTLRTGLIKNVVYLLVVDTGLFKIFTPNGVWQFVALINIIVVFMMVHNRNRLVFDFASHLFKDVLTLLSFLDASVDVAQSLLSVVTGGAVVSKVVSGIVLKGTFVALGMSLDAASILMTSLDIRKGSVSEYGEKILKVGKQMKEESEMLNKIYDDVKASDDRYSA